MKVLNEQIEAHKTLSNIIDIFHHSKGIIRPHTLVTGTSGAGKSYLVEQIAVEKKLHYMEVNAAQVTVEGVAGNALSKILAPLKTKQDKPVVMFVDEFDKLLYLNGSEATGAKTGVQDEFLKLLESKTTSVFGEYGKYDTISCEKVLFIFAGAFGNREITGTEELAELGIRNEFLGRVGIHVRVNTPTLTTIINSVNNASLLNQYLQYKQVDKKEAVKQIVKSVTTKFNQRNLGMRLVNTAIHEYFLGM